MSKLMNKCDKELKFISKLKSNQLNKYFKNCNQCIIKALSEISHNCFKGNIPMNDNTKNILINYKKILKKLKSRYIPLKTKRKFL